MREICSLIRLHSSLSLWRLIHDSGCLRSIFLTETASGHGGGTNLFDAADQRLQSWAYWEYKSFCREDNNSQVSQSQNGVYGACKTGIGPGSYIWRTFAEAVAGNATSVYYNTSSRLFKLQYKIDPRIVLPTVIRLSPPQNYPAGFAVDITPASVARAHVPTGNKSRGGTVLEVHATALARHGEPVTVTIAPNPLPNPVYPSAQCLNDSNAHSVQLNVTICEPCSRLFGLADCASRCRLKDSTLTYAGVEAGHCCRCGHELARPNQTLPMSECLGTTHGIPCVGNRGIADDPMCGGAYRLFVAEIEKVLPP